MADHRKAKKKVAFVHIDYESSGYTPFMDKDHREDGSHLLLYLMR